MSFPFLQPYAGLSNSLQTAQAGGAAGIGGWVELGRSTLGSAGDTMEVTGLADKRYLMLLSHRIASGSMQISQRFNSDSGTNYSSRWANDGASDSSHNTKNFMNNYVGWNTTEFNVSYVANLAGKEKLMIGQTIADRGSGAGTANSRKESVHKWANTSNAISEINMNNIETGSLDTGSELVVLGWTPDDTHTSNFWEELASVELSSASDDISSGTFDAKRYLWIQGYIKQDESTASNMRMQFNGDTGSNYAERQSTNGGSDTTGVNADHIPTSDGGKFGNFFNAFIINNSSNEKLAIVHGTSVNTEGAGTAQSRREIVGKWANTSSQITSCRIFRTVGGQFQSSTILKVWGAD